MAAGYPTSGTEATITSWGSANFYSTLLAGLTPHAARVKVTNHDQDITGLDVANAVMLPGLKEWSVSLQAYGFATPRLGNVGTVTLATPTVTIYHIESWEWSAEAIEEDITELGSAPTWMSFRPDGPVKYTVRLNARADSANAAVFPNSIGDTLSTATLLYGTDVSGDQISGGILLRDANFDIQKGRLTTITYEGAGTGAWTPAGTNSPLGTSALGVPLWSQGGAAVGAMVVATRASHAILTGADSFWKKITIGCSVGKPVSMNVEVRGTGTLTPSFS